MTCYKIPRNCLYCGGGFQTEARYIRRGAGKYCSHSCSQKARYQSLEERFWSNVIKHEEGCWEWVGNVLSKGYGSICVNNVSIGAHRHSWILHYGPIQEGMWVLHYCDNPPCTRPDHLYLGNASINNQDRADKGRDPDCKGENGYHSKLTEEEVRSIRQRFGTGLVYQKDLAREYGVKENTISSIVNGVTWRHI